MGEELPLWRLHQQQESAVALPFDLESMDKLAMFRDDPILIRFVEKVIKPNTWTVQELVYELDPGKDVKYS